MAMSRFSCDVCGSRYQTLKQLLAHRDCPRCNGRVTLDPGDFHVPVCISCGWRDYPETEDWQRQGYRGTKWDPEHKDLRRRSANVYLRKYRKRLQGGGDSASVGGVSHDPSGLLP